MRRPLLILLALITSLAGLGPPATAQTSVEAGVEVEVDLGEVLDVLTYRVHTVFVAANGRVFDRTVPAVVGVPTPVNVDGLLVPDMTVEILPLPPNLITVTFNRLPTAPAAMRLLSEVIVDVPGGVGAAFGFDTRNGGQMPPSFNTNLTFGLGATGTSVDLFANTSFPSSTPTIGLVGEVFTKGAGGARVDPTGGRVDLTPVPGKLHLSLDSNGDPVKPAFDVAVESGLPTTATVDVRTVDDGVEQAVDVLLDKLPENVTVTVTGDKGAPDTKADDRQDVIYRASAPIAHVHADLIQRTAGVVDGHIEGDLSGVPASIDVGVVGTKTTFTAATPLDVALVGFNLSEASPLPEPVDTPAEPVFVLAQLDSLADPDAPLRQAAIRVLGIQTFEVDTADPLVVDLVSAGGPLRARVTDTTEDGEFTLDGLVESMPADVRVTFSKSTKTLTYDTVAPADALHADVVMRTAGAVVGHIEAQLTTVPASVVITIAGTKTTLVANEPLEVALVGFNLDEASPLPDPASSPAEPVFVVAALDTLADPVQPVREAAIRVPGVRSFEVDTGDPLVVDLVSAGGPLRAKVTDTREAGEFSVDALVDALPVDARVEFSTTKGTLTYDADAPINLVTALVDEPDGFTSPGQGGAAPTHLDLRVEGIPGAVNLAFAPPDDDADDDGVPDPPTDTDGDGDLTDEGKNLLARFDGNGAEIGAITALLTSGPTEPFRTLPAQVLNPDNPLSVITVEDGVVLEDSAGRFVAFTHVTGLRSLEVVSGGPEQDRRGFADAQRIAVADVDLASDRPFLADLRRDTPEEGTLAATAVFSNLAPQMHLELFGISGDIPCDGSFKEIRCLPGRDVDGDGFIDELVCETERFGNICVPPDQAKEGDLVDPDGDGFAAFDCLARLFNLEEVCLANDPDGNGIVDAANLGVEANYTAQAGIDAIRLIADPGADAHPLSAIVQDVPTQVSACFSQTEACARVDDGTREGFVFDFDASAPLTFTAGLCLRPATAQCEGSVDHLALTRMQMEDFSVELDSKDEENPLTVVLDTENKPVRGLFNLDKGPLELTGELGDFDGDGESGINGLIDLALVDANIQATPLPDGLVADRVKITKQGTTFTNLGGQIACPEGFNAEINASLFILKPIDVILFELFNTTTIPVDLTAELCGTE